MQIQTSAHPHVLMHIQWLLVSLNPERLSNSAHGEEGTGTDDIPPPAEEMEQQPDCDCQSTVTASPL